jgi:hypothetical protein
MTDLRQLMHETVAHDHADMVRLAVRARKHGTTLRRRRRLAVAGGLLAVLTILGGAFASAGLLLPGAGQAGEGTAYAARGRGTSHVIVPAPDGPLSGTPSSEPASPGEACTQRRADLVFTPVPEAGEALKAAVASVAEGTTSNVSASRKSATCHASAAVTAVLDFAPAGGSPAGQVSVHYDPVSSKVWGVDGEEYVSQCYSEMEDCQIQTLPDGTTVRTYATRMELAGGTWEILIADRLADGYVVSVQAQGPRADDEAGTVLGPDAVLSADQVIELAQQLTPVA